MSTVAALLESAMIALVLAVAIGLLAFGLFYATDALERNLDRPERELVPATVPASSAASVVVVLDSTRDAA